MAEAQLHALRNHEVEGVFHGSITYFLATEAGYPGRRDRRFDWAQFSSDGLTLIPLPCLHGVFEKPPACLELGQHLSAILTGRETTMYSVEDYSARFAGGHIKINEGSEYLEFGGQSWPTVKRKQGGGRIEMVERFFNRLYIECEASSEFRQVTVFWNDKFLHAFPLDKAVVSPGGLTAFFKGSFDILRLPLEPGNTFRAFGLTQNEAIELGRFQWAPEKKLLVVRPLARIRRTREELGRKFVAWRQFLVAKLMPNKTENNESGS